MSVQTEVSLQKLPPQNIEAEQMVLGAILIENDAINNVMSILTPEDFYKDIHRRIFTSMLEMFERREAIDLVTLTDALRGKVGLEAVGGASYLATLVSLVPTAANIKYHAKIVREKSVLRQLIHTSTDIITQCYDDSRTVDSVDELLNTAERSIFEIAQKEIGEAFWSLKNIVGHSFKMVEDLYERKEMVTGIPTGFVDLDNMTSGLQPSDLIIIAGRPSMGKTAFCLNIAAHAAIDKKKIIAIFSLEMARNEIVMRLLSAEAAVALHHMRSGTMGDADWDRLARKMSAVSEAPLYIDDSPNMTMNEIRAKCRRLKQRNDLRLIVIDYIQLMSSGKKVESRQQEVSEFSRQLKLLAKELDVPIVALSQLNRGPEQRTDKRPMLSDLRESGSLEQDADIVILIHREDLYDRESPKAGEAELIVAKHRNGPTKNLQVAFQGHYSRFVDMAK